MKLRELIRHAKTRSSWHANRLNHVNPAEFTADDLSDIPVMTKADLMDNWDEIVTDSRLTLDLTTAQLERGVAEGRPGLLLDEYVVVATGGSSGHRAVEPKRFNEKKARWPQRVRLHHSFASEIAGFLSRSACLSRCVWRILYVHPVSSSRHERTCIATPILPPHRRC